MKELASSCPFPWCLWFVKIVSRGVCEIGVTDISSLDTLGRIYLSTYMDIIAHEHYVQMSLVTSTRVA